jgi:hypothetical protein
MYEIHMPEMSGRQKQNGSKREVMQDGTILYFQDGSAQRQTFNNSSKNNGIAASPTRREIVGGHILDFVQ